MNFSARIKCAVAALVLCSTIGALTLSRAQTPANPSAGFATADVAPTRIDIVAGASSTRFTRVHVGRPRTVSANPTARDVARTAR
ncbi:MAG: hypothetical protein ACREPT_12875 [Rudaea sp.]